MRFQVEDLRFQIFIDAHTPPWQYVCVKPRKKEQKPGIGLHTHEQEKNATPFGYLVQIVVGAVFTSLGIMLGYDQYESPVRRSPEGLITAAAFIVIGIFIAHAGAIFWYRRLRRRSY
jgi:hypothetical protein